MIQFSLKCAEGHRFESWFQSSEAFQKLLDAKMVSCAICGSPDISKSLMAPRLGKSQDAEKHSLRAAQTEAERALSEMRRHVEENSEYVGVKFAAEALKMHEGETPARSIYGEAKPEDAKRLIEEGVPVAPLPFMPQRKTN